MKPTPEEEYFTRGGHPLQSTCVLCRKPYAGKNTMAYGIGYGVYRDFPAHVSCEKIELRREYFIG